MNTKRIELLDAVRGFCMLGIMIVNLPSMNTFPSKETTYYLGAKNNLDEFFSSINFMFFNGKFYPIFAILFGLGSFIFYRNALDKNIHATNLIYRRYLFLLPIGLFHILFVWWGDILTLYSILGLFFVPFIKKSQRFLAITSFILLIIFPFIEIFFDILNEFGLFDKNAELFSGLQNYPNTDKITEIYSAGTFLAITKQRMLDYLKDFTFLMEPRVSLNNLTYFILYYAQVFGCFTLGAFIGKSGIYKNIQDMKSNLVKYWIILVAIIFSLNLFMFTDYSQNLKEGLYKLQSTTISLFYLLSICLLFIKYPTSIFINYFKSVGKMSLTSYVAHTIFGSFLFYNYGLGLFGKIGTTELFFIAIFYYSVISISCLFWLKKYKMGPLESAWRLLTYHKVKQAKTQPTEN